MIRAHLIVASLLVISWPSQSLATPVISLELGIATPRQNAKVGLSCQGRLGYRLSSDFYAITPEFVVASDIGQSGARLLALAGARAGALQGLGPVVFSYFGFGKAGNGRRGAALQIGIGFEWVAPTNSRVAGSTSERALSLPLDSIGVRFSWNRIESGEVSNWLTVNVSIGVRFG